MQKARIVSTLAKEVGVALDKGTAPRRSVEARAARARGLKFCPGCRRARRRSSFHANASRGDELQGRCKDCRGERERERTHRRGPNRGRVDAIKQLVAEERERRGKGCEQPGCDETEELDWHHVRPEEKLFNISNSKCRSLGAVRAELAKCKLVCLAHHRAAHAELKRRAA